MYAEHIFFNVTILGDADGPALWTIWTNEEKTKVGITCLDNIRIWRVIEAFELTIDVSIVDAQFMFKWNYCIKHYWDDIKDLQQKRIFKANVVGLGGIDGELICCNVPSW